MLAQKIGYIENFRVVHSNTLMEMPFLDNLVNRVRKIVEENGNVFDYLYAPMKDRFMYSVLGRGVAIPNRQFRWCTDKLKLKPIQRALAGAISCTGERLGESYKRDIKLKKEGCGASDECGLSEQSKIMDVHRPILNWTTCQVWDFIALCDIGGMLPGVLNEISAIYSINEASNGSMRTGCIGCPLVAKDKSLEAFVQLNPSYAPLNRVKEIYERLRLEENRLIRFQKNPKGRPLGAIKLVARYKALMEVLEIQVLTGVTLIQPDELTEIKRLLRLHTYPRGYTLTETQVLKDIQEFDLIANFDILA